MKKIFSILIFSGLLFNSQSAVAQSKAQKLQKQTTVFCDKMRLGQLPSNIKPYQDKAGNFHFYLPQTQVDGCVRSDCIELWVEKGDKRFYWRDNGCDGVCDEFNITRAPLYNTSFHRVGQQEKQKWQGDYRRLFKRMSKEIRTGKHGLFSGVRCFVYQILLQFLFILAMMLLAFFFVLSAIPST